MRPKCLTRALDELVDLLGIADVDLHGQAGRGRRAAARRAGFQVRRVPAADDDAGAELAEPLRHREADSGSAAGHDRHAILEQGSEHSRSDYWRPPGACPRQSTTADAAGCYHTPHVDCPRRQPPKRSRGCSRPFTKASTSALIDARQSDDALRESLSETDVRLCRPTRRRRKCVRSRSSASSIRRRATSSSSGCSATARSPITCCACVARTGRSSGSKSRRTPKRTPAGVRIEALMRDVSERKRLEDQARDLYHQLLQAEKLAALGQTISGVAHELNNPLATILTWAERLSQRPVDEQTRRGLDAILSESERAAQDRAQPADVRAKAPHDARDGRPQSGGPRNARPPRATSSA